MMTKRIHIAVVAFLVLVQGLAMSLHVALDHANTAHHYFFHHDTTELSEISPNQEHEHSHGEHGHSHPHEDAATQSSTDPHCAVEDRHDDEHHRHKHGHADTDHPVVVIRPDISKLLNLAITTAPLEFMNTSSDTLEFTDEPFTFSTYELSPSFMRGPPSA